MNQTELVSVTQCIDQARLAYGGCYDVYEQVRVIKSLADRILDEPPEEWCGSALAIIAVAGILMVEGE